MKQVKFICISVINHIVVVSKMLGMSYIYVRNEKF